MRILVYPHDMGIGGSQLNAIELAAAVRDMGHEVILFGRPGPLVSRVEETGLEFVCSPHPRRRPSPTVAKAIAALVRDRGIDVVHGYEWPPVLDAVLATWYGCQPAVVATVMSMSVPPFIPRDVNLVVGTEAIAAAERRVGRQRVSVIEPPVDLAYNDPASTVGIENFRSRYGIDDSRINVVSVSRFARELKLEGILTAIDEIGQMARTMPVRFIIVGDGPARLEVERRAKVMNAAAGEPVVILTGELADPRPAYAAADIALGMGGSALRALAFGKPLIVQGERGFWRTLTSDSATQFLSSGWYGIGADSHQGASELRRALTPLVTDAMLRRELGEFGSKLVTERFALPRAANLQVEVYRHALENPAYGGSRAKAVALGQYSRYYAVKRAQRALGREPADDFNARPVTAMSGDRELAGIHDQGSAAPLIWIAGVSWDDIPGTDKRLALELAKRQPILWVDSPRRGGWAGWWRRRPPAVEAVHPGITRLRTPGLPGFSRWPIRYLTAFFEYETLKRNIGEPAPSAVVIANPVSRFPRRIAAPHVFYVTDDWISGASLLGYSKRLLTRAFKANLRSADGVAGVTPELIALLPHYGLLSGTPASVVPNGAPIVHRYPEQIRQPVAGVVGQLNERLDLPALEEVVSAGVRLRLIGPRTDSSPDFGRRLDALLEHAGVEWTGALGADELAEQLGQISVGLTPYADTAFNRASFPLKTLEYIAAGIPVISTDLSASRWIDSVHVTVTTSPASFAAAVVSAIERGNDADAELDRTALAAQHGWRHRADDFSRLVGLAREAYLTNS